ncbi:MULTISPECIES: helix-turn-helix transcriptional regulator [Microvirgula]|uniref:helix-turn-helix transcriptional regulator n=1 Tax=Microvirgula TaxID=57479 RepID=UPI00048F54BF|nr:MULTISPECIES: helix-turn-helix transcriptional regulator [Microvirgula]RAS19053.1 helix-turn-helix protein [Microvirgula sp. AG722]
MPSAPQTDAAAHRTRELGTFLRSRRESLDPVRLGLPRVGRRRTPGLRREEVAQLAEVGVTWYTWLEQGRPIQASARSLGAIAVALQCSAAETRHLFALAGLGEPVAPHAPSCERLSTASRILLDQLDPLPALIQNARFDILGYNPAYSRLIGVDLTQVPHEDRNCIYLALTHPVWRSRLADWNDILPRMVASFRAAMAGHLEDPQWGAQLQRFLSISADFRDTWQRNEVRSIENQSKRFRHPLVGVLELQQVNWWSAPRNGDRLLVYVPVDADSERALKRIAEDGGP